MGQSFNDSLSNMKMFVVLALAALAYAEPEAKPEAEADAALLYGAYGYAGYPYAAGYGYPYGYRTYGYPYTYGYYGKRSADAEPEAEADPALLYTTSHVVNPVTSYVAGAPLVYNTHPVTSVNNVPVVKAAVNTVPVVNTVYNTLPLTHSLVNAVPAATTTVSKREAEADPPLCSPCCPTSCLQHRCPPPSDLCRPCSQGPRPWSCSHCCRIHPLLQRWSLPQQHGSPGPMLNFIPMIKLY